MRRGATGVDAASRRGGPSATWARANMPSPAFTACGMPQTRQTVSRPWRCGLASSMSSWMRLKLCSSSTAAASGKRRLDVAADGFAGSDAEERAEELAVSGVLGAPSRSSQPRW